MLSALYIGCSPKLEIVPILQEQQVIEEEGGLLATASHKTNSVWISPVENEDFNNQFLEWSISIFNKSDLPLLIGPQMFEVSSQWQRLKVYNDKEVIALLISTRDSQIKEAKQEEGVGLARNALQMRGIQLSNSTFKDDDGLDVFDVMSAEDRVRSQAARKISRAKMSAHEKIEEVNKNYLHKHFLDHNSIFHGIVAVAFPNISDLENQKDITVDLKVSIANEIHHFKYKLKF